MVSCALCIQRALEILPHESVLPLDLEVSIFDTNVKLRGTRDVGYSRHGFVYPARDVQIAGQCLTSSASG